MLLSLMFNLRKQPENSTGGSSGFVEIYTFPTAFLENTRFDGCALFCEVTETRDASLGFLCDKACNLVLLRDED